MNTLARAAATLALASALGACTAAPPAPALSPAPATLRAGDPVLHPTAPAFAQTRQTATPTVAVQRASGTKTALIVLGIAAAAVVVILLANGGSGSAY
jgi:hypothetical protein